MSRIAHRYDESDAKGRSRSSRPRTKERPAHKHAIPARVVGVDRGRYRVVAERLGTSFTAMKARELGRKSVVVGDVVDVVGDTSGTPGTLARIVRAHVRTNFLRRSGDDTDLLERIIVANMDIMCIVVAAANPEPRPRMIDRCLVAAHEANIEPMVVVTKCDVSDAPELRARFSHLTLPIFDVATTDAKRGVAAVGEVLQGRRSVLLGHSGVGKSTLVNALVPHAERETGHVNDVTGRGRHTSSSAVLLPLPQGGSIVDTPGVRSFGLGHIADQDVVSGFVDLAPLRAACEPGCDHMVAGCAIATGVAHDPVLTDRYESLRALLVNRSSMS